MGQELECLHCNHTIQVTDIFECDRVYICPKCGKPNFLEWDYISWGNPCAWFVKNEEEKWINKEI